jgi:class 3 adenylate cyclase/tetratricopeptide (TPR) repeat protein
MAGADLVTILFTDLVGSTATLARLGEEAAEELRQAHFAILREAIAQSAGREVKNLGDGLMAVFGTASEAIGCGVTMQQQLERHNRRGAEPLAVRIGVAVGEVTCDESDYFGTPVVEAARLCGRAGGGEILVTDMVRMLAGGRGGHRFESLGPVDLKGLPDPVPACRVLWEPWRETGLALPLRLGTDRVAFVGRSAEQEVLEQAWKRAREGVRQLVLIAGEPGVGKTRLATEVALTAHGGGAAVLLGVCDEDLAAPYQPFVEALRHYVVTCSDEEATELAAGRGGHLARLVPELRARVPALSPPDATDPDTDRYLFFEAVAGVLATASAQRPIVLLLDDLHWATKPTLLLLRHIVRHASPMALLMIGTYRDADLSRDHPLTEVLADLRRESGVERVLVRGLSDSEAVTLMEALAGHELDHADLGFARAIRAETDGSPFFMREILRHLIETGMLEEEDGRWSFRGDPGALAIPESVREVIGRRLWRLGDDVNSLLRLAAVIGREFDTAVLAAVAGLEGHDVVDALGAATAARLVREVPGVPGRFTFVHALVRHTLYEELGGARRLELHRAVGEALERLAGARRADYVTELAHHWTMAMPALGVVADDAARAVEYAEAAGRRAMESLAYEEAVGHLQSALHALTFTGDRARRPELLLAVGEAQRSAGDPAYRETLLHAGRLAAEAGDLQCAARAALANHRGLFSQIGAVDRERVEALEAALQELPAGDSPLRARLLASLATELHFESETRREQLGREALAIARRLGDDATLAEALAGLWLALWHPAFIEERSRLATELTEVTARLGDRPLAFRAGMWAFFTASEAGDMERADAGLATCCRVADELGQPVLRWRATFLRGHRAFAAGRFDEADRLIEETMRLGQATGQPDSLGHANGPRGVLRILQGRPEEAPGLLTAAAEQNPGTVIYRAGRAWAYAEAGRLDEAAADVADIRGHGFAELRRDFAWICTMGMMARACTRLDDTDAAAELSALLIPYRASCVVVQTAWLGPVAHELGHLAATLGNDAEADGHFAAAEAMQEHIGAGGTLIHTRLEWGRSLLRRRPADADRAIPLLEAALAGARELGLTALEPRIAAVRAEAG